MKQLVIIALCIVASNSATLKNDFHQIIAYDCNNSEEFRAISLRDNFESCEETKAETKSDEFIEVFVRENKRQIRVFSCEYKTTLFVQTCGGFFSLPRFISSTSTTRQVSRTDCMNAAYSGEFVDPFYNIEFYLEDNKFIKNNVEIVGSGKNDNCYAHPFKVHTDETYEDVIIRANFEFTLNIAMMPHNLPENYVEFENLNVNYSLGDYYDATSKGYHWVTTKANLCDKNFPMFFKGPSKKCVQLKDGKQSISYTYTSNDLPYFIKRLENTSICNKSLFSTQIGGVYIGEAAEDTNTRIDKAVDPEIMQQLVQSRMEHNIITQREENDVKNRRQICLLNKSAENFRRFHAYTNKMSSDERGYLITQKAGYIAAIKGAVVMLKQCQEKNVTVRFIKECTKYLPVSSQGSDYFVKSKSSILVTTSPLCSSPESMVFFLNGKYYNYQHGELTLFNYTNDESLEKHLIKDLDYHLDLEPTNEIIIDNIVDNSTFITQVSEFVASKIGDLFNSVGYSILICISLIVIVYSAVICCRKISDLF